MLASAGINCGCVCLSVHLSQVIVLLKLLNIGSCKQCHTIAQGLWFPAAENLAKLKQGSTPTEGPNAGVVGYMEVR